MFRSGFDFDTSFVGTDLLKVRVETGSGAVINNAPGIDETASVLEPTFGSAIDYSISPPTNGTLAIGRLVYSFKPTQDLTVSLGPDIRVDDYADFNSYAKLSFLDFSTRALVKNLVLFPVDGPAAGAAVDWKPNKGNLTLRAVYGAAEASNPGTFGPRIGNSAFTRTLYPQAANDPNVVGDRGLFGNTYQGVVELEYSPSRAFSLRLQYTGGELFSNNFDAIGANAEFTFAQRFGIFGRYGYSNYKDTVFGDINPNYWMAGLAARDLFKQGAIAGIAIGQPFIASEIGNSTQTNLEVFYNYPVNRNIQITPAVQVINKAGNQDSNGTIVTGTIRTVFSF